MRNDTMLIDFLAGTSGKLSCHWDGETWKVCWRDKPELYVKSHDFREAIDTFISLQVEKPARRPLI